MVIITLTWQSQANYPMLLEMSVDYPILLPPQGDLLQSPEGTLHPLILNKTLKLAAWTNFRKSKEMLGLSEKASNLLVSAWRKGTQSAYNSC